MKIKNKIKTFNMFLLVSLVFALPFAGNAIKADVIPVIPLEPTKNTFDATPIGNSSYFIVQPDFESMGIQYNGKTADIEYTSNSDTGNVITATIDGGNPYNDGAFLPTNSRIPEVRTTRNLFFDNDLLPRLVNISDKDVELFQTEPIPFSLHMGNSFTFFFNETLEYLAHINTTSPFFLDVDVKNPNAEVEYDEIDALSPNAGTFTEQTTEAFFPGESGLTRIKLFNDNSNAADRNTIVTLNPLPFNIEQFGSTQIPEGQFFIDTLEQGECQDLEAEPQVKTTLEALDIQFFQFPVESGNTYQIYFYEDDIYDTAASFFDYCFPGTLETIHTGDPDFFNYRAGTVTDNDDGLVVNGKEDGFINITLYSKGLIRKDISFYFREANEIQIPEELTLDLNTPVMLKESPDYFYTFTLNEDTLFAINHTDTPSLGFNFEWFRYDSEMEEYMPGIDNNLRPEVGNLLNDSLDDLWTNPGGSNDWNWYYIPKGMYKLEVTSLTNADEAEFQFNTVSVESFSGSTKNLDMSSNKIYAFELPFSPLNFNTINVSTLSHNNISVTYEYMIFGKYQSPDSGNYAGDVPLQTGTFTLGNQQDNGTWIPYNVNNTILTNYIRETQEKFVPIMLVRPFTAVGLNQSSFESDRPNFSQDLTVTSFFNSSIYPNVNLGTYIGSGYHITDSQTVSTGTITTPINDDKIIDDDQVFGFPMTLFDNQLYNLTVYLEGSHYPNQSISEAGYLNGTIQSVHVHSGNFFDTHVLGEIYSWETNESSVHSQLFLSITSSSYLFIDLERNTSTFPYYNSTLKVILTPITVKNLELVSTIDNFVWNETVSELELADTEPLWNVTDYSYSPGGDLDLFPVLVLVGIGGVVVVGGAGIVAFRRRRGVSGKFP
jgi:hypothetical protein